MDGVVPRTRLTEALSNVYKFAAEKGLDAGNVFHAGDGNLHPHVLFDANDPLGHEAALEVSHKILRMCIEYGGTISGEHGVGIEKRPMMSELFTEDDLAVMERVRGAFDPERRLNPGKILPGGAGCGEGGSQALKQRGSFEAMRGFAASAASGNTDGPWI
jgi:FAD/FMN-containing dehydrogenase